MPGRVTCAVTSVVSYEADTAYTHIRTIHTRNYWNEIKRRDVKLIYAYIVKILLGVVLYI